MATWASKSFDLVAQGGYLDKLAAIYPIANPMTRPLDDNQRSIVQAALKQADNQQLLTVLLGLGRFPFNDPYVGFLRQNIAAMRDNPRTVQRICNRLRHMGSSEVLDALERPAEANRQMGGAFPKWLRSRYSSTKSESDFETSKAPVLFLNISGTRLKEFANRKGCNLRKRPSFVAKANGRYVVGQAKFTGAEGGNQDNGFDDALSLANQHPPDAISVAVLDGIIWIPGSGQMSRQLEEFSGNALTALLLDDFLHSPSG